MRTVAPHLPFTYQNTDYALDHLNAFEHVFEVEATTGVPKRQYTVWVTFGHHCFTEDSKPGDDPALFYIDSVKRDPRTFNFKRWELSKHLPEIVKTLINRKVFHTGHKHLYTIEILQPDGERIQYEVYFDIYRPEREKRIHLKIASAFARDQGIGNAARPKPIKFEFVLFNVQNRKPIKIPR
jgi:hypothetical protein